MNIHKRPPTIGDISDILHELREIYTGHPTQSVRKLSQRLTGSIDAKFNSIALSRTGTYETDTPPSMEEYREWFQMATDMITALHVPEPE